MKKIILAIMVIATVFICCKKDVTNNGGNNPGTANDSTVVLNNNVFVIDTTKMKLTSTVVMLNQGIYEYSTNGSIPAFKVNDVIVGSVNQGYIRQVAAVTAQPNKITLQTTQGSMADVFKSGVFNFNVNTDNTTIQLNGLQQYEFNNLVIYKNGPLSITLNKGTIALDPNWNYDFRFKNSQLDYFKMGCTGASFTSNFELDVNASQAVKIANLKDTLKETTNTFVKWIPVDGFIPVPVVVVTKVYLIATFSATIGASVTKGFVFNSTNTLDLGVEYSNAQWQPVYNAKSSNKVAPTSTESNVNTTVNMSITPVVSVKLYGLAGPYASVGLEEEVKGSVASPSLDWDLSAGAWLHTTVGANAAIFGKVFDYNKQWYTDTVYYKTPDSLSIASGNNQVGMPGQQLGAPLVVQVLDNAGFSQAGVPVYFNVDSGGGKVNTAKVFTDAKGYAKTEWTLGAAGIQKVSAIAKKADGTVLHNAPVIFTTGGQIKSIHIGDTLYGGIVFYIDKTGMHGMVVSMGAGTAHWTNNYKFRDSTIGKTDTIFGSGSANTSIIINTLHDTNCAAYLCNSYNGGGYTDWFLPSKGEMDTMAIKLSGINSLNGILTSNAGGSGGGSVFGFYIWTSSECQSGGGAFEYDCTGYPTYIFDCNDKFFIEQVLAVRKF